ncbi:MAG: hypothetical protein HY268_00940 [Deltaproteobacteria bacterium]|nr:hypothetical protein [Deltaproteobacteria bacterium]
MDDNVAFTELSALLTGLYDQLLNDPEDRAHDVPNLWIVGSRGFPTSTTANQTLTIATLPLRTAQTMHRALCRPYPHKPMERPGSN